MIDRQEVLKKMKKIEDYFQQNSLNNALFKSEFECARTIRGIAEKLESLTSEDVAYILNVYNETNAGEHYSGSGWLDYQLHLIHLLTIDNFEIQVDNSSGQMRIITR
jgi:hypothetical protein